jgi:hypothetical protein
MIASNEVAQLSGPAFWLSEALSRPAIYMRETVMISGAHSIIYSKHPAEDRAFLRDVLKLTNVDVGDGWLIFGLPPAEVAVHPSDENDVQELYLMCDDVKLFVAEMKKSNIACGPVQDQGWGLLTHLKLPGGGQLGVYQPRHARPNPMDTGKSGKKAARRVASKPGSRSTKSGRRR